METRELYKQKYEAQLKECEAKVQAVHAYLQKAAAQAQIDLKLDIDSMKATQDATKSKSRAVAAATDEQRGGPKQDADNAGHDLKSSVEGAFAATENHQSPRGDAKPNDPGAV